MTPIFIDTSAFVALLDRRDKNHTLAAALSTRISKEKVKSFTTDYVLDETFTTILKHAGYQAVAGFDDLLQQSNWYIARISDMYFDQARKVFLTFNKDKEWSFTDCTSYIVMKELKITSVFTFDEHFQQMGFQLLQFKL